MPERFLVWKNKTAGVQSFRLHPSLRMVTASGKSFLPYANYFGKDSLTPPHFYPDTITKRENKSLSSIFTWAIRVYQEKGRISCEEHIQLNSPFLSLLSLFFRFLKCPTIFLLHFCWWFAPQAWAWSATNAILPWRSFVTKTLEINL